MPSPPEALRYSLSRLPTLESFREDLRRAGYTPGPEQDDADWLRVWSREIHGPACYGAPLATVELSRSTGWITHTLRGTSYCHRIE